jgi:hypothetical protein
MDWIEDISTKFRNGTGELVCPRCNGTGINPDYNEVNVILVAIDELYQSSTGLPFRMVEWANRAAPYCPYCYGLPKIDWIQYSMGTFRQEFVDKRRKAREGFLTDIGPFLAYLYYGKMIPKLDARNKYMHFDQERKSWVDVNGPKDDIDTLREVFKWLHRFHDDDCWDIETAGHIPLQYQELHWTRLEDHLKTIKVELLRSVKLPLERVKEIKNDLDLFWYPIETLDHIEIEDSGNEKLSTNFKFTWENILRKFGLPLDHLPFFNSEKIEHKK